MGCQLHTETDQQHQHKTQPLLSADCTDWLYWRPGIWTRRWTFFVIDSQQTDSWHKCKKTSMEGKGHKIRKTLHLLVHSLDQASLRQTCFSWFHLLSRCYLTLHHSQNIFIIWELEYIFFHWYFWLFFWISTVFIVDQELLKKVFFPLFLTSIKIDEI